MCRWRVACAPGAEASFRPISGACRWPALSGRAPTLQTCTPAGRVCRAWARRAGLRGSPRPSSSPLGPGPGVAAAPAENPVTRPREALSDLRVYIYPSSTSVFKVMVWKGLFLHPPLCRGSRPPVRSGSKGESRPGSPAGFLVAGPFCSVFHARASVPLREPRRNRCLLDIWALTLGYLIGRCDFYFLLSAALKVGVVFPTSQPRR